MGPRPRVGDPRARDVDELARDAAAAAREDAGAGPGPAGRRRAGQVREVAHGGALREAERGPRRRAVAAARAPAAGFAAIARRVDLHDAVEGRVGLPKVAEGRAEHRAPDPVHGRREGPGVGQGQRLHHDGDAVPDAAAGDDDEFLALRRRRGGGQDACREPEATHGAGPRLARPCSMLLTSLCGNFLSR